MEYTCIFPGHPNYHENKLEDLIIKAYKFECGKFSIKYNFYNTFFGFCPSEHKKKIKRKIIKKDFSFKFPINTQIEVFDNNILICVKSTQYMPCVNIWGDGINPENTFYSILEDIEIRGKKIQCFNIYNMNNHLIKSFEFNYSLITDIKITKFKDDYYIICMDDDIITISKLDYDSEFIGHENCNSIILPTLGTNKMYVIEITNNFILFNNGKICQFDNIDYELSKFIFIDNPLYDKKLLQETCYPYYLDESQKHYTITHGNFSAEFNYRDHHNKFDSNFDKFAQKTQIIFKEKEEIIFVMYASPSIVIHGDGITREGTKFCIGSDSFNNVSIYDMNQKLIRNTQLGVSAQHDIQRVNEKYAISITVDCCTHAPYFELIDLYLFFSQTEEDEKEEEDQENPYDNARTYIPIRKIDSVVYVTCVDEKGFTLNNGVSLSFDNAKDFDFNFNAGFIPFHFLQMNYSDDECEKINNAILEMKMLTSSN